MRPAARARSLLPALALVAALTAAACGSATTQPAVPSEVIETAEALSRAVTITAPYSTTPVADDEHGPIALSGRVFGHGATGVILAHMRPADQTAWFPFATKLAATNAYTVLTFDFRGFGESEGDKDFDHVDTDLIAAYDYMRHQLGISRIYLVGASMGGTASIVVGARLPVAGVVSISSPAQFQSMDALAAVPDLRAPKLFVSSADDVPAARSQEELWAASSDPKEMHTYAGDAHGTNILQSEAGPDLEQRIIAFLTAAR
jgi:pimeloyl-ACP methyl ester carboxylesterase